MRINLNIQIDKPRWWYKIFSCKHNVVRVEENFDNRYGTHTSYKYCLRCGRKAMDIGRNCKHKENMFGKCEYCKERLSKKDCLHLWEQDPDTDDFYCLACGEWQKE